MNYDEAMMRLRSYSEFVVVIKELEKKRPELMPISKTRPVMDAAASCFYESGQQAGFDLVMNYLRGKNG